MGVCGCSTGLCLELTIGFWVFQFVAWLVCCSSGLLAGLLCFGVWVGFWCGFVTSGCCFLVCVVIMEVGFFWVVRYCGGFVGVCVGLRCW